MARSTAKQQAATIKYLRRKLRELTRRLNSLRAENRRRKRRKMLSWTSRRDRWRWLEPRRRRKRQGLDGKRRGLGIPKYRRGFRLRGSTRSHR